MQGKIKMIIKIEAAIDAMDGFGIAKGLDSLSDLESQPISPEDPMLFAARIQKLNKERIMMIKPIKGMRVAIVAAVVLLMGLTVYAANAFNLFSFQQGDKFVTVRTTQSMTEQEAKEYVSENAKASVPDDAVRQGDTQDDTQDFTFDTVQQAEKKLNMNIAMPSALPDMKLDSATGTITNFGVDLKKSILWLNYSDDAGRMFGITAIREIVKPGADITRYTTNDIDEGSLGTYKSKSGVEFTTLTESNETGEKTAHIATTMIGEYEYSLVFFGFDEAERHAIIDSTDLSIYK